MSQPTLYKADRGYRISHPTLPCKNLSLAAAVSAALGQGGFSGHIRGFAAKGLIRALTAAAQKGLGELTFRTSCDDTLPGAQGLASPLAPAPNKPLSLEEREAPTSPSATPSRTLGGPTNPRGRSPRHPPYRPSRLPTAAPDEPAFASHWPVRANRPTSATPTRPDLRALYEPITETSFSFFCHSSLP